MYLYSPRFSKTSQANISLELRLPIISCCQTPTSPPTINQQQVLTYSQNQVQRALFTHKHKTRYIVKS